MKRLLLLPLLALLMMACTPASVTPEPTPSPTPEPTPIVIPATPTPATLTLWLPDWMILDDAPGRDALMSIIAQFEQEKGVQVEIVPKLPRGEGGLLDALRKTKPIAPSVLPDIIVLPLQDVQPAADEALLQPLDGLFSESVVDDYYPFARQAGQVNGAWMAMPFAASFEHLAFQPAALSEPPVNWDIILSSATHYSFPAGGADSLWTDALLLHYLSAVPAGEAPERNKQALRTLLDFYEGLFRGGFVDASILQISSPRGTWEQALQGETPLAETTANLWLSQRAEATFLRFGPTPTHDGQARYIIHGWAYALITADETHQTLATELINRLIATPALADWSLQSHVLPARSTALLNWPEDDFRGFANEALEKGILTPAFTHDEVMVRSLHQAARAVLGGEMNADQAWRQAIADW